MMQTLQAVSFELGCGLCIILTILFLFVKLVAWVTGWHFIGVALLYLGCLKLLKMVGTFALYPGSFRYVKSDIQMRESRRLKEQISNNLKGICWYLEMMSGSPASRGQFVQHQYDPATLIKAVRDIITMYELFKPKLSQSKKQLLSVFMKMDAAFGVKVSIDSLKETRTIEQLLTAPNEYYDQIKTEIAVLNECTKREILPIVKEIVDTLKLFPDPERGFTNSLMYRLYKEKLFQIKLGYFYWHPEYEFSHYSIPTQDGHHIEAALVEGLKKEQPCRNRNKAMLFCCPNGVYLQYFLLDCQYARMYLELGYQIVLWNYRGYGQSTGSPSISQSLHDAETVFRFFKGICNVELVHGYSIGGPPAVYLAHQYPEIRTLVVDRSFCSFVNIAEEMSPVLAKLARFVMKADSKIKISEYYLKVRNANKILIWSPVDEIISNGSSLKMGILSRIRDNDNIYLHPERKSSPKSTLVEEELAETDSFIEEGSNSIRLSPNLLAKSQYWIYKLTEFFQSLATIHQQFKNSEHASVSKVNQSSQDTYAQSLIQQIPQSQQHALPRQTASPNIDSQGMVQNFWHLIWQLDGGGTRIRLIRELVQQGEVRIKQLQIETKSFVLGLLYFGLSYHDKKGESVFADWNHTIDVLNKTEKSLEEFHQEGMKRGPQLTQHLAVFGRVLKQIRLTLLKSPKPNEKELGILIPTESGHNGHLTESQFSQFYEAVKIFEQA